MVCIVIALGGSLLRPEVDDRHAWLEELIIIVRDRVSAGDRIGLVIGGGAPAREGIGLAQPLIDDVHHLDKIGIAATRLNATIVREALSDAGISVSGTIPHRVDEAVQLLESLPGVVMGGTTPGHTTDTVAIRFAIATSANRCIIATNVGKVYSADPRNNSNADAFDKLTHDELQEIVGPDKHTRAGGSSVVDPVGVGEANRANMTLNILDGRETNLIKAALEGNDFKGTTIITEEN